MKRKTNSHKKKTYSHKKKTNSHKKKTKKRVTQKHKMTKRTKQDKKEDIIDPPFSKKINIGTLASTGGIDYHYQDSFNILHFINNIKRKNKNLKHLLCSSKNMNKHMLEITKNKKVIDVNGSDAILEQHIHNCFQDGYLLAAIPIVIEYNDGLTDSHSNVLIINNITKYIELFEPKGGSISEPVIKNAGKILRKYFKKLLPTFTFNEVSKQLYSSLQSKYDMYSGMCVSWSILYLHYRLLNLHQTPKNILGHIRTHIKPNHLLRHARYVEDLIKRKI